MTATVEPQPRNDHAEDVARAVAGLMADSAVLAVTLDHYAAAFTTLSRLVLSAPTAHVLTRVREAELLDAWPLLMDPDCRRGTALLAESAIARETRELVTRDYDRLFTGPAPKAPPRESAHRPDDHLPGSRTGVGAEYDRPGLPAPRRDGQPDDHLGVELFFLAALCDRARDALESGREAGLTDLLTALVRFLDQHLLVWGPRCLVQAANASTTFFYQGVAALGLGTLASARATFLP